MEYRELGRTGWKVSTISFGAWAIGSAWGPVDDHESYAALNKALDLGLTFSIPPMCMGVEEARLCWPGCVESAKSHFTSPPKPGGGWTRTLLPAITR